MKAKHILLSTDFSDESRRAYPAAVEMARDMGARLSLIHVVEDLKVAPHGAPLAPMQSDPEIFQTLEDAKKRMKAERQQLPADLEIETVVEPGTDVARVLAKYVEDHDVDLVAISTHGRSGLRRLILGSTTEQILRHAHVPVICFPPPSG